MMIDMKRTATVNINEVLVATQDVNALADAQGNQGLWLQYGQGGTGKCVSFGIPDARLSYSEADNGQFVTRSIPLMIDAVDKSMSIQFPYF